ncbi:MAG: RAD55 family ATPase, partial [Candidatus Heimdallarchaeota archaeon]
MATSLTLDEILPRLAGKTVALFGDLSGKRNILIKQFILDGLQSEGTSCIVTLTSSAGDLIDELNNFSADASILVNDAILNERLQIIDMYSFRGIKEQDMIPGVHMLPSANELTLLSITLNKISKSYPKSRIIIWPFSLLSIYTREQDIVNFTQTIAARIVDRKQAGLLIGDTGVMNSRVKAILESLVDCVIETRKEEIDGQ